MSHFIGLGHSFAGEGKSVDSCNADLNAQLALCNSVPSGGELASNDRFNALVSGGVDGRKVVDVC